MTALVIIALAVSALVALCGAMLASTRPRARSSDLVYIRPSERITARRERIVERSDRWGRPMRITEREILELPTRGIEP